MKVKTWHEGMSDKETADLAYWERNMLALKYANGWYNDDVDKAPCEHCKAVRGPRYPGWRRVLTLQYGSITFHVPDDFDVGSLPQVEPCWDGHTTEQKWQRIAEERGIP